MIDALSMGLDAVQNVSGAIKRAQTEGVGGMRTGSSGKQEPVEVGFTPYWCLFAHYQGCQHAVRCLAGPQGSWNLVGVEVAGFENGRIKRPAEVGCACGQCCFTLHLSV